MNIENEKKTFLGTYQGQSQFEFAFFYCKIFSLNAHDIFSRYVNLLPSFLYNMGDHERTDWIDMFFRFVGNPQVLLCPKFPFGYICIFQSVGGSASQNIFSTCYIVSERKDKENV